MESSTDPQLLTSRAFILALRILDSLEVNYDFDAVLNRLRAVAIGEISVADCSSTDAQYNEPLEGWPLSDIQIGLIRDLSSSPQQLQELFRETASQVLHQLLGTGPNDSPDDVGE
jgi:hypothetical protein